MEALVGNSKVVPFRPVQKRIQQPKAHGRKVESRPAGSLSEWMTRKATNGTVLVIAALSVVVTLLLVTALVKGSPAPGTTAEEYEVPVQQSTMD